MKHLLLVTTLATFLSSCMVTKTELISSYTPNRFEKPVQARPTSKPVRLNHQFAGNQCFEPMLYVLSLGIIPAHCVGIYQYEDKLYKVTDMTGWIPAIYPLFSNWRYESESGSSHAESIIKLAEQAGGHQPPTR